MDRVRSSILAIIAGNLLLFAASAWLGWSLIHCLIVYWLESWLLLPLTLARIWLLMTLGGDWKPNPLGPDNLFTRLWEVLTFCAGFVLVTYIAGILVLGILPVITGMDHLFEGAIGGMMAMVTTMISRNPAILAAVLIFAVEHLVTLVRDSQSDGAAWTEATAEEVAKQAMQRQVYLLGAVIVAAFAILPLLLLMVNGVFGKMAASAISLVSVAVLVLLKTAVECVLHLRQTGVRKLQDENGH